MRNTLNLVTPFQAVKELKSVYTVDIAMGEKINVTCLVLLYNGSYWHEVSYINILYSLNISMLCPRYLVHQNVISCTYDEIIRLSESSTRLLV